MANSYLTGKTILLRHLEVADAASLFKYLDNDAVWKWLRHEQPTTENQMISLIQDILQEVSDGQREAFAIFSKSENEVIGTTSFFGNQVNQLAIEIGGTFIGKSFWRTGINREAKLLLMQEAFETREFEQVIFKTDSLNSRSIQAITDLGATFEFTRFNHMQRPDGTWRDSNYYSIVKEDWVNVKIFLYRSINQS
jgi:RimJ/RimL family protein N-acetyltransferase